MSRSVQKRLEAQGVTRKINWSHNAEGRIVARSEYGYIWLTQVNGTPAFEFQPNWKSEPFFSLEEAKDYAERFIPDA